MYMLKDVLALCVPDKNFGKFYFEIVFFSFSKTRI